MRLVYPVTAFICLLLSCCYCQDLPPIFELPPPPPFPVEPPPLGQTEITTPTIESVGGNPADVHIESNKTHIEQNDTSLINDSALIESDTYNTSSNASIGHIVTVSSVTDNPGNDSIYVDVNVTFDVLSSNGTTNETVSDNLVIFDTSGNISDISFDKNLTENINSSGILTVKNESMLSNESQSLALPEIIVPRAQQLTPEIHQDNSNMTADTAASTYNETFSQNETLIYDSANSQNETENVSIEVTTTDSGVIEQPLQLSIDLPPPPIPDSSLLSFEDKPGETTIEISDQMMQEMVNITDFKTINEIIPTTTPFSITKADFSQIHMNSSGTNVTTYDITTRVYNISETQPRDPEKPSVDLVGEEVNIQKEGKHQSKPELDTSTKLTKQPATSGAAFAPDHPPPIIFGSPESFIPDPIDQGPVYAQATVAQRIQGPTTEAPPPPIFLPSTKQDKVIEINMPKEEVLSHLDINYEDPRFMNTLELAAFALQMSKERGDKRKPGLQTFMRGIPEETKQRQTTTSTSTTIPTTTKTTTIATSSTTTSPTTTTSSAQQPTKQDKRFLQQPIQNRIMPNFLRKLYESQLSQISTTPITTTREPTLSTEGKTNFYKANYLLELYGLNLPTTTISPSISPRDTSLRVKPIAHMFYDEKYLLSHLGTGTTSVGPVENLPRKKTVPTIEQPVSHINKPDVKITTAGHAPPAFPHEQLLNNPKRTSNIVLSNRVPPPAGSFAHERLNINMIDPTSPKSLPGVTQPNQGLYDSSKRSSFMRSLDTWLKSPELKQPSLEQFGPENQALIKNQQKGQSETRPLHPTPHQVPLVPYNIPTTISESSAKTVPTDTIVSVSNAVYMFKPRGHVYGDTSINDANNAIPDTLMSLKSRFNKKWSHQESQTSNEHISTDQARSAQTRGSDDLFNKIFKINVNIPSHNFETIRHDEQRQLQKQQKQLNEQVKRETIKQQQRQHEQIRLLEKQRLQEQTFQDEQRRLEEALRAQEVKEQQRLLEFQKVELQLQQRIEQQKFVEAIQQKQNEKQNRLVQRRLADLQERQQEHSLYDQQRSIFKPKEQVRSIPANEMPLSARIGIRATLPNSERPHRSQAEHMQVSSIQIFQAPGFLNRPRNPIQKSTTTPTTQRPIAYTTQQPHVREQWHAHVDWSDLHGHLGVPYKVKRQQFTAKTMSPQTTPLPNQVRVQPEKSSAILLPINTVSTVRPTALPPNTTPIPTTTTTTTTTTSTTTTQRIIPPTADPNPPPIFDTKVQMTFMPMPQIEKTTKPSVKSPSAGIQVSPNFDERCIGCVFINERCLLPDPVHCNYYIECVRQNNAARAFNRECALGSFFDRKSFLCVDPKNADCPTDRCREADTKWYPIHGHCKHYWSCGMREGGSPFAQSECCPDMGGFVDGQGCIENKNCTDSCEKPIQMDGPKAQAGMKCSCANATLRCDCSDAWPASKAAGSCAPILSMTFNDSKIVDESNTKQHIGVEGVTTSIQGEGLFSGSGRLVLWRYANYMFPVVFAVRLRFLSASTEPRYQTVLSNCDTKSTQQPSFEVSIDTLYHEVIFKVDTYTGVAKKFKIMYNHNTWTEVDVIYDGERIVGAVDRRPRNMFAAGGIETRPYPISVGSCSRSSGFKGLMDDVNMYEDCVPDEMYGIFMSVLE
ncbi:mucin-5AC-like isoform X2 [Mya arenaria]|uniref:mucin-5AC-like isoform X2 n=1 Tax=Mya arenaria TaxID=6604 RepID=UPI0022DFDFFF|nr:mucin-5AC-like isoform X2 [Mya arenaria]